MATKKTVRGRTSGNDFLTPLEVRRRAESDPVAWMAGIVPVVGPRATKI